MRVTYTTAVLLAALAVPAGTRSGYPAASHEHAQAPEKKAGLLKLRLRDARGDPLPARVHLYDSAGKPVRPEGLPFWRDHFACPGQADLPLVPGDYRYEIERGPEYEPVSGRLSVGESTPLEARLSRISDLAAKGWYSGDLHIHRPPADARLVMRAEDLHVGGVITWWNKQNLWATTKPPNPAVVRFDGRWCDLMGGEDERGGGAMLYFRRRAPLGITTATREYPSSLRYLREAKKDTGTWADVEKPFWWDVPAWLATGQVDSIGVAHNHMHRGGVMDNEAWGRPRDRERYAGVAGNGWWTQEVYYHMLNAGLRVPPSAGSASGVLPNPVGYNRVWVHTGKPLDPTSWWEGLRAGRAFVSNGPLLVARAAGELPGHVFREAGEVEIDVEAVGVDPIRVIEVVQDGMVVLARRVGKAAWKGKLGVRLERSGWLLVRAVADVKHTFRFASTAPWFVEVGGGPRAVSRRSVEFFHGWARERRDALAMLVKGAGPRKEVLDDHDAAVKFWWDRLAMANRQ
ncbi:MAG: CehA/McbA family metallohydrolase [Gemmataceae bacterium]